MQAFFVLLSALVAFIPVEASPILTWDGNYNDGIHLAVSPKCGSLSGTVTDVNAGVELFKIDTIVSFGVCFWSPLPHGEFLTHWT